MARQFNHPSLREISIDQILYALSDPMRRGIILKLASSEGMSCSKSCAGDVSPSTISFHHKILRESGLIRSKKMGVEVINTLRKEELDKKFPGLLDSILKYHRG